MKTILFKTAAAAGLVVCMASMAMAQDPKPASTVLKMNPTMLDFAGSRASGTMYMPNGINLSDKKPDAVKREPTYTGPVQYGVLELGDGPKEAHPFAIETPSDGTPIIHVDLEGNGDLTKFSQPWPTKTGDGADLQYSGTFVFRVSYGTPRKEVANGQYGINFYWSPNRASIFYYRAGERTGNITVNGQQYSVRLIENNNNGVYNVPFEVGKQATKPVWIVLDGAQFDARGTFAFGGFNYEARLNADGSDLTLQPTARAVTPPRVTEKEPDLLPVGSMAPDFEVPAYGGGNVRLSDLRGKVVVLDFWATWCGPCKASLPHVEKIEQQVEDKGVYVLAVNVWDDKKAYDLWVPANTQYTFHFAYDPAGRDNSNIAKSKYNVSGIPTTYVIDQTGKIAAAIVGYDGLDDHRLEAALSKLNVAIAYEKPKTIPAIGLGGK